METPPRDDYSLSLKDFLLPIWKRLWVVALVVLVLLGAGLGFTLYQTPIYESSIKLLVGQKEGSATENLGSEIPGLQQLTQTMTVAVDTRPVAETVVRELDLSASPNEVLDNLSAEQDAATLFIDVSYRDPDPVTAQRVANTVGEVFSKQISEANLSAGGATATVWVLAEVPQEPASPSIPRNLLLALALGLMLGVGLAFLLEYLDDSWRSPEEVEQIAGVPTFGVVPAFQVSKGRRKAG